MIMTIVESIKKRRSVRTFTGEPLSQEHRELIKQYISELQTPFGEKARIELISIHSNDKPIKLGTYGFIKGAKDYLALIFEEGAFTATAAGYMFEQLLLFCTGLGLGTCWLGGSFSRSDFKKQIQLKANEKLKIVSPVGYPSYKQNFLEKYFVNADKKHATRYPFGALFFDKDFGIPLIESAAGVYFTPLEMVRLAPSASNMQIWRVILDDKTLHFYKKPYYNFESNDIGIALCHFELTCKELGINGKFEVLKDFPKNDKEKIEYVISWVL
ncbi:MAG: nitroreductase family protein [Bacteroidales bacterium]|jgi:nitroreductase|nr:nitroreductase family protein [Bacteroidales bacterium]